MMFKSKCPACKGGFHKLLTARGIRFRGCEVCGYSGVVLIQKRDRLLDRVVAAITKGDNREKTVDPKRR